MKRETILPRPDWHQKLEKIGFDFHTAENNPYWNESVCYSFSTDQINQLETAAFELNQMCYSAIDFIIKNDRFKQLSIPDQAIASIIESWDIDEPTLYGRFDFAYDGNNPPKMLEYNADTPTSILEAAVAQWFWLKDQKLEYDQFNSIHEKLIEQWKYILTRFTSRKIHFACVMDSPEDFGTVTYLRDTAIQAGVKTEHIFIEDIGWNTRNFVDLENKPIDYLFKLYPWEWLLTDEFGSIILKPTGTRLIEPIWKMLLSNKGILAILWELFPKHPNLLPAYFKPDKLNLEYVKKPLLSREGSNIEIVSASGNLKTAGTYGSEGFVYQELAKLREFDSLYYPIIGAWIIGDEAAGIGIREDRTQITGNLSQFIPHYIK